jgi:hypothetical protein
MPEVKADFWTDDAQAAERIKDTYVMFGNDIVEVNQVLGGVAEYRVADTRVFGRSLLRDAGWHRFRKLPPLGWMNTAAAKGKVQAVYLRRSAQRTRQHGLSSNNVIAYQIYDTGVVDRCRTQNIGTVYGSGLYRLKDHYPPLRQLFPLLQEGQSIAISDKYCVFRDTESLTWLFRKRKRIGLIPDTGTLLLLRSQKFYREEIESLRDILPLEIKEL